MSIREKSRQSAKRPVGVPLGTPRLWRGAVFVVAVGVIASATMAQQHIAATAEVSPAPIVARLPISGVEPRPAAPVAAAPVAAAETAPVAIATGEPRAVGVFEPVHQVQPPRATARLALPTAGIVEVLFVRVGDRVETGQTLLTFNDEEGRSTVARLRLEAEVARSRTVELERAVKALDASIATLTAALPAAAPRTDTAHPEARQTIQRAQSAYNEAVARERRAAALEAHGMSASEELEQAQVGVRASAAALALARREADATATMAEAQALQLRAQADAVIAEQRRQRDERARELAEARLRQGAAETAVAAAAAQYKALTLRAPAGGIVTEVAVQPGDRTVAGTPLVTLSAGEVH